MWNEHKPSIKAVKEKRIMQNTYSIMTMVKAKKLGRHRRSFYIYAFTSVVYKTTVFCMFSFQFDWKIWKKCATSGMTILLASKDKSRSKMCDASLLQASLSLIFASKMEPHCHLTNFTFEQSWMFFQCNQPFQPTRPFSPMWAGQMSLRGTSLGPLSWILCQWNRVV